MWPPTVTLHKPDVPGVRYPTPVGVRARRQGEDGAGHLQARSSGGGDVVVVWVSVVRAGRVGSPVKEVK